MPSETILVTPLLLLHGEQEESKSSSIRRPGNLSSNSTWVRLTIYGRPTTKKTKNQVAIVAGRPRVFPSKKWREWVDGARVEVHSKLPSFPIKEEVNCRATFYRWRNAGDAVGYYQALADFLETCLACRRRTCSCNDAGVRILADDKWIVSWDGSRLRKDNDDPRIEVTLTS